jgi:outer membrane protein
MLRIFLTCFLLATGVAWSLEGRKLSLQDAIFLSLRENPNVLQTELNQVLQKYAVLLSEWHFKPQYTLSAKTTSIRNYSVTEQGFVSENSSGMSAGVSLLTPYGTEATFSPSIDQSDHFHPGVTLAVVQPLLRGFGRPIVEAELLNARDNEKISHLNMQNTLRLTVTTVINAYLDVLAAQKNLEVDRQALQRAQISLGQTKAFIKSGRKAGVELVAVDADAARARTNIENDKNALKQARFSLLLAIGVDPNATFTFENIDVTKLIAKYKIPPLDVAKQLVLENDIQYQTDQITLEGATQRALLQAEDAKRWKLDINASASSGNGVGGGENAGLRSLVNGINQTSMISLNLTVPIDDRAAKIGYENAKIALKQSGIAIREERYAKEINAITGWNNIFSAQRALQFAEDAAKLQKETYQISFQKYGVGLTDSLQLQNSQQQLIFAEQALNAARINYLKALVNYDLMLGHTLLTWQIPLRSKINVGSAL